LRLRGRGIHNARTGNVGDQLVKVKVVMPANIDAELEDFMRSWAATHEYDPRARMKEAAGV
jgi:DnaJ-class molecular chaperone